MPATLTKIELKGAKIVETPTSTGVAVSANRFEAIVAALANAKEIENNTFDLDPSVTDVVVAMGNITDAEVLVLIPDGLITVKLNASTDAFECATALILFGTDITAVKVSNPSATEVRSVLKYLATTTT
jgi:hypothetical protein